MVRTRHQKQAGDGTTSEHQALASTPVKRKTKNKVAVASTTKSGTNKSKAKSASNKPPLASTPARQKRAEPSLLSSPVGGASVASTCTAASTTASGKKRPGLHHLVVEQLAQDIEIAGGIGNFKLPGIKTHELSKLLNKKKRKAIYKTRGDPIRIQLSNKVDKWKAFTDLEYQKKVIKRHGTIVYPEIERRRVAGQWEESSEEDQSGSDTNSDKQDSSDASSLSSENSESVPLPSVISTTHKQKKKKKNKEQPTEETVASKEVSKPAVLPVPPSPSPVKQPLAPSVSSKMSSEVLPSGVPEGACESTTMCDVLCVWYFVILLLCD